MIGMALSSPYGKTLLHQLAVVDLRARSPRLPNRSVGSAGLSVHRAV